jgi:hypothetical protein
MVSQWSANGQPMVSQWSANGQPMVSQWFSQPLQWLHALTAACIARLDWLRVSTGLAGAATTLTALLLCHSQAL